MSGKPKVAPQAVRKLRRLVGHLGVAPRFDSTQTSEGWLCQASVTIEEVSFSESGTGRRKLDAEEAAAKALLAKLKDTGYASKAIIAALASNGRDYTTALNELCQILGCNWPEYKAEQIRRELCEATVTLRGFDGNVLAQATARAKSKTEARRLAAKKILIQVKLIRDPNAKLPREEALGHNQRTRYRGGSSECDGAVQTAAT